MSPRILPLACLFGLSALACSKADPKAAPAAPAEAQPSAPAPAPTPAQPEPEKPVEHLILLTVDSLRADMPWLGYPRDIAPNLTKLAESSVVYSRAYSISSYTSMSLAGLMSGRYPGELARDGRTTSRFGPEALMLAEVLAERGFHTLGVHGHVYFLGDTGIKQGFAEWHVVPRITMRPARDGHVTDAELADLLLDALRRHASERPKQRLFAWAHFMDPHYAYVAHELVNYSGDPYALPDGGSAEPLEPGARLSAVGQRLRNLYDREVRFTDAQVGRVLDYLQQEPAFAGAAIVVSADHGEAFGEHKSYFEHGYYLHEVVTRVPLLVHAPGLRPKRLDVRRSHIDLPRTFLELLDVPAPESFRGTSLVAELRGGEAAPRDIVLDLPYTDQTPRRRALIHGSHKLVVTETEQVPTLFDLTRDPSERQDLASTDTARLTDMLTRYERMNTALPDFPAPRRATRSY
ncbi:MAG: sulfatase [Polyangiaceae bacterium]|nr:sulfatase [Polyangiaceae bacterium]